MYAIHTTPGFIIGSKQSGEAGKLLYIFTRDLGLILAIAQGTRLEKSKLRPFIQDYSLGTYSFVHGKEFWRLTNAQEIIINKSTSPDKNGGLMARIALLLSRLLQGEEPHPELFETIDSLAKFINTSSSINKDGELLKTLESLSVIRILQRLGYISLIPDLKSDIESDDIKHEDLVRLSQYRISLNQHINRALRESHL